MTVDTKSEDFKEYYRERKQARDLNEQMVITDKYMNIMNASRPELVNAYDNQHSIRDTWIFHIFFTAPVILFFAIVALSIVGWVILLFVEDPDSENFDRSQASKMCRAVAVATEKDVSKLDPAASRGLEEMTYDACMEKYK